MGSEAQDPRRGYAAGETQLGVLEASPNAVVAIDDHGQIIYVNPQAEATFGYGRAEVIGRPVELLIPERVHERHVGHRNGFLEHPFARPMGIGLDLAGRRKDGSEFPVEISLAPVDTRERHAGLRHSRRHHGPQGGRTRPCRERAAVPGRPRGLAQRRSSRSTTRA